MRRFDINYGNAQSKFSALAYRINPVNLHGAFMRGGIRLS